MGEHPLTLLAAFGLWGLGLGIGLIVGAYLARGLRRFIKDEDKED